MGKTLIQTMAIFLYRNSASGDCNEQHDCSQAVLGNPRSFENVAQDAHISMSYMQHTGRLYAIPPGLPLRALRCLFAGTAM
jgi:hypothetical protein